MAAQAPEFTYVCPPDGQVSTGEGPLSGLRLAVKDLFHIAGIPTGAGNPDWLKSHSVPEQTSSAVEALLAAGATLVGKTLTDELAYSLNGINAHYGTPLNVVAPSRIPGGSTSGSAVAVANLSADIGLGTDTGGSIRVPASYNGLYGLRPSHDVIPTDDMVALAPRFDTVGWLCRDLETLVKVANVYARTFSFEERCAGEDTVSLRHVTVCSIVDSTVWDEALQSWAPLLEEQFESVSHCKVDSDELTRASAAFRVLQGREIWRQHGDWILKTQPVFAPDIQERMLWCRGLDENEEAAAQIQADHFLQYWRTHVLPTPNHVALMPTAPGAAPLLDMKPDDLARYRSQLMGLTAPAGLSRAPQLSLPWLQESSAPWGVSLTATRGQDRSLLQLASSLEAKMATLGLS
ncbi:amidase [Marinibactrum halimedae]|uniref:Glutamyl-tRNA(Gln) amidotransferase n=1 Tax=Marinibactrum halimedae TaxID=1444977 RepID=A0AA37T2J9_9GAMM|nr:amidase [Marinibactrum halimedae]MCD9459683.1 amidase [Marinibactrum halimedae]GLS25709.1 glutamyl-tRNA(Gln) amidotransferase [Marinibactrum halimedae]